MSWLYSQALVEEYSEGICSDGAPFVPLSGTHMQQAFCVPDKMTEFSRLSRYGMTYRPLTADLGEALLMSYLEAFPVRTLAQPERAQESPETGQECGFTWPGSWAKYDPVSCSWKTRQCSLLGDLEPFSETWPRWGTMQDGEFWELPTLAPHTSETESGLLPTPTASPMGSNTTMRAQGETAMSRYLKWPTPTVCGNYNRKGASANSGDGLATAVAKWPTPCATDYKGSGQTGMLRDRLDYAVERGATKSNTYSETMSPGGQLNPTWVEWLMGWPLAWTDLKPLETDKFQQWQQQHGEF